MFDTSVVRSRAVAAPNRYGLLTASVVIHSALVIAAISAGIASTRFPTQPPDQMELFRPVDIPVIPPALGVRAVPRLEARAASPQTTAPAHQEVAPNETPRIEVEAGGGGLASIGTGQPESGDPNGVAGGISEVQPQQPPATIYAPGVEVHGARVLHRVQPNYPASMIPVRFRDVTVTVRAVIDKEGRLRDAQVIQSSWAPFNDAVLQALSQWSFAPGTRRGEPVDTYFELTVKFVVR